LNENLGLRSAKQKVAKKIYEKTSPRREQGVIRLDDREGRAKKKPCQRGKGLKNNRKGGM